MVSTAFPSPALPPQRRSREVGLGMGSSPLPCIPAPPRCLAPTTSGTCKGWRWRQEKGPQLTFLSYKYISLYFLSFALLGSKKEARARGSRAGTRGCCRACLQHKWKFREEVTRCLRTRSQPQRKGCGGPWHARAV